jgi:aspartate aminotransferase-like enzyme
LLPSEHQSPIITDFFSPTDAAWAFEKFYRHLKQQGFVIYPGKVTEADTFRSGTIGYPAGGHLQPVAGGAKRHVLAKEWLLISFNNQPA